MQPFWLREVPRMSKDYSGLFNGTSGAKYSEMSRTNAVIKKYSKQRVKDWAKKQFKTLPNNIKKKMNTATVVYDEKTGKYYYGRNGATYEDGYIKNSKLFGENGILPKESLNGYKVGNCAEVDAINQALNDGADLKNLHMTTIHTTKSSFGKNKEACENCTATFKGKIKQNYTGWKGEDKK